MRLEIPSIEMKYPTYIVGGWVRDKFIDPSCRPHDLDLCMVAPSFDAMREAVIEAGGKIYVENPEHLTLRCKIPDLGDVDVAVARKDGAYSDGRRPDSTCTASSIEQDLCRRDFTCNAIAVNVLNGEVVDPFKGINDIRRKRLQTVGIVECRFKEDYLRIFRAIRFAVTKKFIISSEILRFLKNSELCAGARQVSKERIYAELLKACQCDTVETITLLARYDHLLELIANKGIKLIPTLKN